MGRVDSDMGDFNLNDFMEFDRVVEVGSGGEVSPAPGVWGPEQVWVELDDDGQMVSLDPADIHIEGRGWKLLNGFSGQHGYSGPIMHPSEVVGGGLERYIKSHPGRYVVVEVQGRDDETDCWESVGWAVAYL